MNIDINAVVGAIFGAGGIGGVAGWIKYRDWAKKSKVESGAASLARLQDENIRVGLRAKEAEATEAKLRKRIGELSDDVALYRGMLIEAGLLKKAKPDDPR